MFDQHFGSGVASPWGHELSKIPVQRDIKFRLVPVQFDNPRHQRYIFECGIQRGLRNAGGACFGAQVLHPGRKVIGQGGMRSCYKQHHEHAGTEPIAKCAAGPTRTCSRRSKTKCGHSVTKIWAGLSMQQEAPHNGIKLFYTMLCKAYRQTTTGGVLVGPSNQNL